MSSSIRRLPADSVRLYPTPELPLTSRLAASALRVQTDVCKRSPYRPEAVIEGIKEPSGQQRTSDAGHSRSRTRDHDELRLVACDQPSPGHPDNAECFARSVPELEAIK